MSEWRKNLGNFFEESSEAELEEKKSEVEIFIAEVAIPAFEEIAMELQGHGRNITIRESGSSASILVQKNGEEEMSYSIQGRTFPTGTLPYAEIRYRERGGRRLITVESVVRSGSQDYQITDITKDEVIEHFIKEYTTKVTLT